MWSEEETLSSLLLLPQRGNKSLCWLCSGINLLKALEGTLYKDLLEYFSVGRK